MNSRPQTTDHRPPIQAARPCARLKSAVCGLLSAVLLLFTGCASLRPGADPLVVRAQQAEQVAFATFDTYLRLVHDHEARVRATAPAAFTFAEWLRAKTADGTPRGLALVTSLGNVRRAYAANRTAANKAGVLAALAALTSAIEESQKHMGAVQPAR